MSDLQSIRNIGPASAAAFQRAGINTAEELRTLGADAAYAKLLALGQRPHFIGYYILVMALQGRPWNDCKGAEKAALRVSFDALCDRHRATATQAADQGLSPTLARFLQDYGIHSAT